VKETAGRGKFGKLQKLGDSCRWIHLSCRPVKVITVLTIRYGIGDWGVVWDYGIGE